MNKFKNVLQTGKKVNNYQEGKSADDLMLQKSYSKIKLKIYGEKDASVDDGIEEDEEIIFVEN